MLRSPSVEALMRRGGQSLPTVRAAAAVAPTRLSSSKVRSSPAMMARTAMTPFYAQRILDRIDQFRDSGEYVRGREFLHYQGRRHAVNHHQQRHLQHGEYGQSRARRKQAHQYRHLIARRLRNDLHDDRHRQGRPGDEFRRDLPRRCFVGRHRQRRHGQRGFGGRRNCRPRQRHGNPECHLEPAEQWRQRPGRHHDRRRQ